MRFIVTQTLDYAIDIADGELDRYFGPDWQEWTDDDWAAMSDDTDGFGHLLITEVNEAANIKVGHGDLTADKGACTGGQVDLRPADHGSIDEPNGEPLTVNLT